MKKKIRNFYIKFIRNRIKDELQKQRLKLVLWDMYYYWHIFSFKNISFGEKITLIRKSLAVDWKVIHAHKPCEIVDVMQAIAAHKNENDSIVVEAGCWNGGSSAKFSVICKMMNYKLFVYDSFEGVEVGDLNSEDAKYEAHFYGAYATAMDNVKNNIKKYGELEVCTFVKGFFVDSMKDFNHKTHVAYIDCDLAKGTREVIEAILPQKNKSIRIFTQDYHIKTIYDLLNSKDFWKSMNVETPSVDKLNRNVAVVYFD